MGRSPLVVVAGILTLIVLISTTVWWFRRSANIRWAREKAIPEITQLIEGHDYGAAFALARKAETHIPSDPALLKLWDEISFVTSIHTTPEGADVYIRDYSATAATWEYVGRTPIPLESRLALSDGK